MEGAKAVARGSFGNKTCENHIPHSTGHTMLTSDSVTKGVASLNSVVAPKKNQLEAMTPSDSPKKLPKNFKMG